MKMFDIGWKRRGEINYPDGMRLSVIVGSFEGDLGIIQSHKIVSSVNWIQKRF